MTEPVKMGFMVSFATFADGVINLLRTDTISDFKYYLDY